MTAAEHFLTFTEALEHDHRLAWGLHRIIDRAQAINVDFRRGVYRRLQAQIQLLVHNIDRERRLLSEFDLYAAADRERACEVALKLDCWLVHAREGVLAFSQALERTNCLNLGRGPELDILVAIGQALNNSVALVTTLSEIFAQPPTHEALRRIPIRRSPLWASQRIANVAVRLLPWDERERYLDEFVSELDALAQDKNLTWRAQLAHALQLLVRTPALIVALRASASQTPKVHIRAESGMTGLLTSRPDA
jgi:hypothetical protein